MRSEKIHVLVLFGGRSSEHPISCITAAGVLNAMDPEKYEVVPVGITTQGRWSAVAADPVSHAPDPPQLLDVQVY